MPILLAAATAAAGPTPARGDLSALFRGEDYPLIALRKEEQGAVTVRLSIDTSGMVASCAVVESSGSQALDDQTCSVLRARAQFAPARDGKGRPIESDYTQTIRWNIAGETPPPVPRHAWKSHVTLVASIDGSLVDCETEYVGFTPPVDECEALMTMASQPEREKPSKAGAVFMITELFFYPVDPSQATDAPKRDDASLLARQVSKVTVNSEGVVTACEAVHFSGEASPDTDACTLMRNTRFDPLPAGSGDLIGTFVITAYLRRQTLS